MQIASNYWAFLRTKYRTWIHQCFLSITLLLYVIIQVVKYHKSVVSGIHPVADPDFQLRRGPGSILLAQPAFLPSVIFFSQNKGEARAPRAPPLVPPQTSILNAIHRCCVALNRFAKSFMLEIRKWKWTKKLKGLSHGILSYIEQRQNYL